MRESASFSFLGCRLTLAIDSVLSVVRLSLPSLSVYEDFPVCRWAFGSRYSVRKILGCSGRYTLFVLSGCPVVYGEERD